MRDMRSEVAEEFRSRLYGATSCSMLARMSFVQYMQKECRTGTMWSHNLYRIEENLSAIFERDPSPDNNATHLQFYL